MSGKLNGTIFVDENIPLLAEALNAAGEVVRFNGRKLYRQDLVSGSCSALIVRSTTKVNAELLDGTDVSFVGSATSGTDHVDEKYLKENNIHFTSASGSNSNSVAEYVVYAMLKWAKTRGIQLNNQTIGIVGYGNIGRLVARYAYYMGMRLLVNDPPLYDAGYLFPDYVQYVQLDDICKTSAVITNHVPLTNQGPYPTYWLFREKEMSEIGKSSLFIHASRGCVVDEAPLVELLRDGHLYAAIDVWENEPEINSELPGLTLLSTPHIAGYSRDGKLRGSLMIAGEFMRYFDLKPDLEIINKELLSYSPLAPDEFMKLDELYAMLENSRRLDEDHERMLEAMKLTDEERISAFDRLRKEYPERRETL